MLKVGRRLITFVEILVLIDVNRAVGRLMEGKADLHFYKLEGIPCVVNLLRFSLTAPFLSRANLPVVLAYCGSQSVWDAAGALVVSKARP